MAERPQHSPAQATTQHSIALHCRGPIIMKQPQESAEGPGVLRYTVCTVGGVVGQGVVVVQSRTSRLSVLGETKRCSHTTPPTLHPRT